MTPFPQPVLDKIANAKKMLSDLHAKYALNYKFSANCNPCCSPELKCLAGTIKALDLAVDHGDFDEYAEDLYSLLLSITGGDYIPTPPLIAPTVDAGSNRTIEVGGGISQTAVVTPGSGSIINTVWTQVSGPSATMSGTNTNTLVISNALQGTAVFRITVTDDNGLTGTDTFSMNVTAASITVRWGVFDSDPDLSTAVYPFSTTIAQGTAEYSLDFGNTVFSSTKYIAFDYPATEATKLFWFNTNTNKGPIPDSVITAAQTIGGRKAHKSRDIIFFESPISTLKFSTNAL